MSEFKGNKPIAEAGLSSQSAGQWAIFRDNLDGVLKVKKDGTTTIDLEVAASIPNVIVVNSNITINDSYHNKVIIAETGVVITLPVSLSDGLSFRVWNNSTTNSVIFQSDGSSNLIEISQNFAVLDKGRADVNFQLVGNNYFIEGDMTTDLIPLAIGGGVGGSLRQWIDFSDFDSLTMNGLTIQAASDKSGFNNGIEQLTPTEQAERIIAGQNSLDTARFNQSIYELGASVVAILNSDYTLYVMARDIASGNQTFLYMGFSGTSTSTGFIRNSDTTYRIYSRGNNSNHNIGSTANMTQFHGERLRRAGGSTDGRYFRTSLDDLLPSVSNGSSSADNAWLGARQTATSAPYNGEMGEIILYNRRLNDGEDQVIIDYLNNKWGTA